MKRFRYFFAAAICSFLIYSLTSCQKQVYHTIAKPAYVRVFNDLNYSISVDNKDAPLPYLCFMVDPVIDGNGVITGAAIMGDHLGARQSYAPAYPAHAGNTGFTNVEYPGQENVLVGPILNGVDLSSWAQIPSGKHRIMFVSRPVTATAFLDIDPTQRNHIVVDTTVTLTDGQVYTMETLKGDVNSNKVSLYVRNEQFANKSFSDSLVYVNFYNLGSKGYWQKNYGVIDPSYGTQVPEIKDTVNVYLSLLKPTDPLNASPLNDSAAIGFNSIYFANMIRSTVPDLHPYFSFPLFVEVGTNHIKTSTYQYFDFFAPGYDNNRNGPNPGFSVPYPNHVGLLCFGNDYTRGQTPNLIITTPSGQYNPRSFATINTIEIVNGVTYLMTVQRQFTPPVIH